MIKDIMIFLLIGYKNLFHWNNLEKKFSPVKTNFSASNHLILGYSEVSGNRKEIVAANDLTNNFQGLTSFLNI